MRFITLRWCESLGSALAVAWTDLAGQPVGKRNKVKHVDATDCIKTVREL